MGRFSNVGKVASLLSDIGSRSSNLSYGIAARKLLAILVIDQGRLSPIDGIDTRTVMHPMIAVRALEQRSEPLCPSRISPILSANRRCIADDTGPIECLDRA